MLEANERRIRHMACPFLLMGLFNTVYTVYFCREMQNHDPEDADLGRGCWFAGINVAWRFNLLINFGFWVYMITAAISFLGFIVAVLGKIRPTLLMLSLHSLCTLMQIAVFVNIGYWRFDEAGEFCSNYNLSDEYNPATYKDEGNLEIQGLFLRNIFISQCFFTCLNCCTHYGHKHVRGD